MNLIADAGSTKTAWSLLNDETGETIRCTTSGINPMYQDEEEIYRMLEQEFTIDQATQSNIFFYGSGCISDAVNTKVRTAIERFFKSTSISIFTDMMGAARALCGNHEGIVCILGTGSNSCYFNGHEITANVSPLGYMLGDEGSGAVIGRKFIADLLKNQLPQDLKERFYKQYALKPHEIMECVYKAPFPNRFLAQFTLFIREQIHEPTLTDLVKGSFIEFFLRNIKQYPEASRLTVNFTGGIAFNFSSLLEEAAAETGFRTGMITLSPMEGLISYHKIQKS
jgi:glucosamine kinase